MSTFVVTVAAGFEPDAIKELRGIFPGGKVSQLFFKGNVLMRSELAPGEVAERLRSSDTVYVGWLYPVDTRLNIPSGTDAVTAITDAVLTSGKLTPTDTFRVSCTRRGTHTFNSKQLEVAVAESVSRVTGAAPKIKGSTKLVVVQIFQDVAYVGVADPENVFAKTITRSTKYAAGERPFTRAEFKLKEALEEFGVVITREMSALDVGAAPGGWTKVLAGLTGRVVAVDPAALHPSLAGLENVTHLRVRAEELPGDLGLFDVVTNDMNLTPPESAKVMLSLARHIKPGGTAIMTVKFTSPERGHLLDEAILALEAEYTGFRAGKVPHNRKETTLHMLRR